MILEAASPAIALKRVASVGTGGRRVVPVRSSTSRPRVSVVVPCYNYGHYLPQCLSSVLSQQGVEVDVIVVDDCSPDGSGAVADTLARDDSRIRVLHHERNLGHIRTYNDGLAMVEGDYVVLLSADDLLTPGALARATAVMEQHADVGLVYGNPLVFESEVPVARTVVRDWTTWRGDEWIAAQCRRGMSCIYSPEAVVRASVQRAVGGYDPALPHSGDLDMWLRIAAVTGVARVNGPDQAFRREHAASMMHTTFAAEIDDLRERAKAYDTFFAGAGSAVPGARDHHRTARRRLAESALDLACEAVQRGRGSQARGYADLAHEVCDEADDLWQARVLRALARSSATAGPLVAAHGVRRDLEGRLRWQRWDWSGV